MNKLFNFTENHFLSLLKQKIPLDCIFLLEMLINKEDVDSEEFLPFLQRLQRKGYIDVKGELTEYGKGLYDSMSEEAVLVKVKKKVEKNDDFERWWDVYPATNDFMIHNRHFQGSQKKNIKKDDCKRIFTALCNTYKAEEIIKATEYHIYMAKEISFKKKDNQLTFIPNSERYLREKYFEAYIEKYKNSGKKTAMTDNNDLTVEI